MKNDAYYPRGLAKAINRALRIFPVVVVSGPRQAGKSTMIQQEKALANRTYFTLDDLNLLTTARAEPESLLEAAEEVTIDEAQRAPELFLAIKKLADRRRRPGQFLLSGSANFFLLKNLSDSLAGRACYFDLTPFSAREVARVTDSVPFICSLFSGTSPSKINQGRLIKLRIKDILQGGFPPAYLARGDEYRDWFRAYEQTYLQRDVRQLSQVADFTAFRSLLHLAALRTAQVLNQSELGRDAKLNAVTASRYLSVIETSCLLHRLPPYYSSRTKQLVKSPKLHLADSGLAAYLCGISELEGFNQEPLRGALLETYVNQNLIAMLGAHLPDASLFYWRIHRGREVDFIIEAKRKILAIEIKWASRVSQNDTKGLEIVRDSCRGYVVGIVGYSGKEILPLGKNIWAVPLQVLLS